MKRDYKNRIAALQSYFEEINSDKTLFIVEDGSEFRTSKDPFTYLMEYGAFTPNGQRIIAYPHAVEGVDGLSLSLDEMIDEAIACGKLEFPELISDEV